MNRTATIRMAAVLTPIAAAAIAAGAWSMASTQPAYLADYGASDTAQISMEHAQHQGVQHQHNGGRAVN